MKLYQSQDTWQQNTSTEEPLRSELFSSDQMDQYAKQLATSHKLIQNFRPDHLLLRLTSNEKTLLEVRSLLTNALKNNHQISPSGEWLLDNFYLLEEQIRLARKHLPKGYSEGLPQLANKKSVGVTRVYDIALELISHSDGRIDMQSVTNFIEAYQTVTNLKLGELWAIPIMLRLALIENLRRVSAHVAIDRANRNLADYWAQQMIKTSETQPKGLILIIADMARSNPPLERAFVAELTRQLRGKGPGLAQALNWLEERLNENGLTITELVQAENQKQAADQLSVSNSINSLRLLGSMDWRTFVEANSVVEKVMRRDSLYPQLDFATRDRYRHVIEHVAKKSEVDEQDVAEMALQLASEHFAKGANGRGIHIGYYLIDDGLKELEMGTKMKLSPVARLSRFFSKAPLVTYLFFVLAITVGASVFVFIRLENINDKIALLIFFSVITVISASQLAVSLVNFFCTLVVKPVILPKLDYSKGIPEISSTIVAIPSMLTSESETETLAESLEIRFLANKDPHLYFALITDFKDAPDEHMPDDAELLNLAASKISGLNEKYKADGSKFYLLHRHRTWNPSEKCWMGYERKRGKLSDLNGLLRGNSKNSFLKIIGDVSVFPKIKYVITLDSDTHLPRESAARIIATMAHPLNEAVYDEKKGRVVKGYGILQPRVMVSLPRPDGSLYARINGNDPGLDPYTRATSDVYQDLFEEGSFIGKGIYDIDIFEKTLKGKFPKNRILSHDLLEGCYTRSGLLSDVQLYERYPSGYLTDMKRRHRWIRGDWQIAAWLTPFIPDANGHLRGNPLSALSRWKIFDNIRRSLFPIAITLLIISGWLLLPEAGWWTLTVSALIVLPAIAASFWYLIKKPKDVIFIHHLILSSRNAGNTAIGTMFTLICLPYEAFLNLHAILQTVWRMSISHRYLLQWTPSGNAEKKTSNKLLASYAIMAVEPMVAIAVTVYLYFNLKIVYPVAGPILLLWLAAPFITWKVSLPMKKKLAELSRQQKIYLQKIARKTWAFFETLVTQGENWLPPDNIQEIPAPKIAHRTSPTNIGLALLANLSAYDFGYITTGQLLERSKNTFETLGLMERYNGHFYNWYDTQTLQPLLPHYVSTVDSGNMAGHILTLQQGIIGLRLQKIIPETYFEGLGSTLRILADKLDKSDFTILRSFKTELKNVETAQPENLLQLKKSIDTIRQSYEVLTAKLNVRPDSEAHFWKQALALQINGVIDELKFITPWLNAGLTNKAETLIEEAGIPTYSELFELNRELSSLDGSYEFKEAITHASGSWYQRLAELENLEKQCIDFSSLEWDFLYDKGKHLFTIGYNTDEHKVDAGYYDLLASEARLAIFVAIAYGKVPQESWFSLGRHLLSIDGDPVLLSWSGSMFEYLMPQLVMPTFENTLLAQTDIASVERQIEYGKQMGVPWGASECCYNLIDASRNYQYRAFGVPGLGLKRGLGEDLVIAPYATVLALMVAPEASCQNLEQLSEMGFEGNLGLYEAVDYTPSRLQRGQKHVLIQSYMAHHQGMSLLSLASVLLGQPMQKRFESDPAFNATLLLLEERIPKITSYYVHTSDIGDRHAEYVESEVRIIRTVQMPVPEVQLLSNGNYHIMITAAGAGYSQWKNYSITRWREDTTCDNWGVFSYIRDLDQNSFWSTTFQPTHKKGSNYEVAFSQGRADFRDMHNNIETHTEIVVSPEDDIEMRRVHITNRTGKRKVLEFTTYGEPVISPVAADEAHPAFNKLFVQTEILEAQNAIICSRRPRSSGEKLPWMFHLVKTNAERLIEVSYETDRAKFIGRTHNLTAPEAMMKAGKLSGSRGAVIDPCIAIRYRFEIEPDETIITDVFLGIADNRDGCQALIDKYQDRHHKDRVFELAWTHNQVVLRQINASEADAQLYTRLAASIIFMNPALRADPAVLINNHRTQSGLWPYSVSGDLPIVFMRVEEQTPVEFVKQLVQAHTYWRLKGLAVDLVIWNENFGGYRQVVQNEIMGLVATLPTDKSGGIFVRGSDQISNEDRILFQTVARINISGGETSIADLLNRKSPPKPGMPLITQVPVTPTAIAAPAQSPELLFKNGIGGFAPDGKEYIITVTDKKTTPAPWVNVLANSMFGTVISESGQCYTWAENAHEFRLTPWNNDPVSDLGGEAFYLRDEQTGHYWSATPLPRGSRNSYTIRHGFGYSVFEHIEAGIKTELTVFVDSEASIKFTVIKLENVSGLPRKISITGYTEWVLGELRSKSGMFVITEQDAETGALFARNTYNKEFENHAVFFDVNETNKTFTADRAEFIGRNNTLRAPDAMLRTRLSGKKGIGVDPCAAIQVHFDLPDDGAREIVFKLGTGKNYDEAKALVKQFKTKEKVDQSFERTKTYWNVTLGKIRVETPDAGLNLLANGWLAYQVLACRIWARAGFYQSSGAFGFRDQLQDSLALLYTQPDIAEQQILLCASKQFKEGDVMHWWHPPGGRGVRTHISDDFLWLPFATAQYVSVTGDSDILQRRVNFLEGRLLNPDEESNYDLPTQSSESGTLYEHCVRAIRHGFRFGEKGLPLMGSGDWNDGMNEVGRKGKGESVWLAFFLYDILKQFGNVAIAQHDAAFAAECEKEALLLQLNIEKNGWDGKWYTRAFFDDDSPLGSVMSEECKIDSIAQSWSVLSDASINGKSKIAMQSAYDKLVDHELRIIKLLSPPFDKTTHEPGYIKGYVPGVRENGGQYTHAAVWLIMAFAKTGNNALVWELFNFINPINHTKTPEGIAEYRDEPYVLAGDVYAQSHPAQGGWSWYTGSAGWMYRLIIEYILGIKIRDGKISFDPCPPPDWGSFKVSYRFKTTLYNISFSLKNEGQKKLIVDGQLQQDMLMLLHDDSLEHKIEVEWVITELIEAKQIEN